MDILAIFSKPNVRWCHPTGHSTRTKLMTDVCPDTDLSHVVGGTCECP